MIETALQNPVTDAPLRIRVGCEFTYQTAIPVPAVFLVRPVASGDHRVREERWTSTPHCESSDYVDLYGNVCRRVILPAGQSSVVYDAVVETSPESDPEDRSALQHPIEELPEDTLVYLMPSRYCHSDVLAGTAWDRFGHLRGWDCVEAINNFVHAHLAFGYGSSNAQTTSVDAFNNKAGVCRDYAHLAVSFCRAMNIPARYVFGYIPDIDVPLSDAPMDFCAWYEAYLGGRWWTFDPRNNARRKGRALIARGRDALDVAMVTTFGNPLLLNMTVWADELPKQTPILHG